MTYRLHARLVHFGLSAEKGLLCILSSGTGKRPRSVLGSRVAIQYCLRTKLDQTISALPDVVQGAYRSASGLAGTRRQQGRSRARAELGYSSEQRNRIF